MVFFVVLCATQKIDASTEAEDSSNDSLENALALDKVSDGIPRDENSLISSATVL